LLAKLAKLTACVILVPFQVLISARQSELAFLGTSLGL
jgi:hypothetical protein